MQSRAQTGNRNKAPQERTLNEMCGYETYTDSRKNADGSPRGETWRIRVFMVGEWNLWQRVMDRLCQSYTSQRRQIEFLQSVLCPVEPTPFQRLRRALGFASFSRRDICKSIPLRDFQHIIDAACIANVGKTLVELAEDAQQNAQKKTVAAAKISG